MSTPRSVNDVEVPRRRGLLPVPMNVSEGYGVSVVHVTCSYGYE